MKWLFPVLLFGALPMAWVATHLGFSLSLTSMWSLCVFVLIAPLLEEYVFRAQLQQALHERGMVFPWPMLLASLVFAACHMPWIGLSALGMLVPSLALGLLWSHYRSLWRNVLLHSAFNASLASVTWVVSH